MMTFTEIKNLINEYDSIVLYRHFHPDYDAIGSQLGLKHIIMENWPEKKVYSYGKETIDNYPFVEPMDNPSEEIIKNSLVILLDCSTNERADDQSFLEGKDILKIDHHIKSVEFDHMYVDITSCATAQILTQFAMETGLVVNKEAATYLYAGILTDSVGLSIDSVNAQTFACLSFLVTKGISIHDINRSVFDQSQEEFEAGLKLQQLIQFDGNVAYLLLDQASLNKLNLSDEQAKDYVDLMSKFKGVEKYIVIAQRKDGKWTGSLRSHKIRVVEIAQKYGGGGHALACGIPAMNDEQMKAMLKEFIEVC